MKDEFKKIYWHTGQEITPTTFIEADNFNYVQQSLIRKLMIGQCYGLLPSDATIPEFEIDAIIDENCIYVRRITCYAITKQGYLIAFNNNTNCKQSTEFLRCQLPIHNLTAGAHYVVLRINPFENEPIEDMKDASPSFAQPIYSFFIREIDKIQSNEMPVLKFLYENRRWEIDQNYIIPCISIYSSKKLENKCIEIKQNINIIENLLDKKQDPFRNISQLVSMISFELLHANSTSDTPLSAILITKKIIKILSFYFSEIQSRCQIYLNAEYSHYDMLETFNVLLAGLQEIQLIIGSEEATLPSPEPETKTENPIIIDEILDKI